MGISEFYGKQAGSAGREGPVPSWEPGNRPARNRNDGIIASIQIT
jgi:hypothetical protein